MSELIRAQREATSAMFYMGIDSSNFGDGDPAARVFSTMVASIVQYGDDTLHPTVGEITRGAEAMK